MAAIPNWQFWIDVGGTFTDCIAVSPDGDHKVIKWLSSGITKGTIKNVRSPKQFTDETRIGDPPQFWRNYTCWINAGDENRQKLTVVDFDPSNGCFTLDGNVDHIVTPRAYELWIDEPTPVQAIRYLLNTPNPKPIDRTVRVRLGTTRGTNALLTRTGGDTAWVTTKGFADILEIGTQDRPDLFAIDIKKVNPVHKLKIEIDQRIGADGTILKPIEPAEVKRQLKQAKEHGIEALAICFLHGDRFPDHERIVAEIAREIGFKEICCSHNVVQQSKLVSRGNTTLIDAYLNPVLRDYVQQIEDSVCGNDQSELLMMDSAGGLIDPNEFSGKQSVLSGPAGGVVAMSHVAKHCGFDQAIGFDMGGTSTDVSRVEGEFELEYETRKAGVPIMTPTLAIETVAAGGGSVCWFDGTRLLVGPNSAGAEPGPACYGKGGPLTITDVNLLLGRIKPNMFPFDLDLEAATDAAQTIATKANKALETRMSTQELAFGFLQIANASMAQAIRSVSVAKGYDPRTHALVAFGGAAGQHVCAVADELAISNAIVHPYSSILSAYGMGLARRKWHQSKGVQIQLSDHDAKEMLLNEFDQLELNLNDQHKHSESNTVTVRRVDMRYVGTDSFLTIELQQFDDLQQHFERDHLRLFGYIQAGHELEIVAIRIEVAESAEPEPATHLTNSETETALARKRALVFIESQTKEIDLFDYVDLKPGHLINGPALIVESNTTVFVDSRWNGKLLANGEILLERCDSANKNDNAHHHSDMVDHLESDPVMLEVMSQNFMAIARQMGHTLQKTAVSVNVKERLDFSCALFRNNGDLVANAPHVPVHLGAMSETVKQIINDNAVIYPGDVFVTNDPYRGGSHLPDITVISPVHYFDESANKHVLANFVACRAHHAEIGGTTPGSMPPFSKCLADEGVLIRNFKLFEKGQAKYEQLKSILESGPYPSRSPQDNIRDIQAQVAANRQGISDLNQLSKTYSWSFIDHYMRLIQDVAAKKMRAVLSRLPDGKREFTDHLDDGSPIKVKFNVHGDQATIDFTGTGPVLSTNLNANRAIVAAAVIYCLRLLIDEDIPLNQGVLEPVEIDIPVCLVNPPAHDDPNKCAAVVGGNVETSQRIVDTILGAFGICAASQGTMNNLLFGNDRFGYYETICGGSGASAKANGASAVHTHMTNTRITDPEILESRFPVRLIEFKIRDNSGGNGFNRGGNGVIRIIEFLDQLQVSLLTQRRAEYTPYGSAGGKNGSAGQNALQTADGEITQLSSSATFVANAGDRLTIETPGGGGWGQSNAD